MLRKWRLPSLLILLCLVAIRPVAAQNADSVYHTIYSFPNKFFNTVDQKAVQFEAKVNKQTAKYLQKLSRQEEKLKKQLYKKDSVAAKRIFGNAKRSYDKIQNELKNPTAKLDKFRNVYDGHLDSLQTTLKFLEKDNLAHLSPELQQQFSKTLGQLNILQGKLNQAENIRKVLQQRQQYLKQQLQQFGMVKAYKKFQKDVYYYQQQMQEYKDMFDDPSKIEKKALQLASKLPAFRKFFANHSQLAGLFQLPGSDPMSSVAIGNQQTRGAIEAAVREQLGNTMNISAAVEDNRQAAGAEINALKSKLQSLKSGQVGASDVAQPDFKPNQQKTKSLKHRLEFGTNFQTVKAQYYFPATSDIGLSLGYKLNDKSVVGLGISGKLGLGNGWNNISLSYEGIGVRQFVDIKLKGSFWISGGAEMNYRTKINSVEELKTYSNWQQSALIGLSKKLKVGKAKSQVQLLYDFLWKQQVPVTQPVLFRVGYKF